MFIRDGKRFNIHASQEIDGVRYASFADPVVRQHLGITEIADPARASEGTHYVQEIDEAPYIINTPRPVEQLRAKLWGDTKAKRDAITEAGGCLVSGHWFHTDTKSKQQQMALTMLGAAIPAGLQWKTLSGAFVAMTQQLAGAVFVAQVTREQTLFAIAEGKRAALDAADFEALAAFDVHAGWPDVYEVPPP